MELEQIESLFYSVGYHKILTNLPEYVFYYRKESQGITAIFVIDYKKGIYISEDQYVHMKEKCAEFFGASGEKDVHLLSLILSEDTEAAKKLCVSDSFCWMIDLENSRLIIHENQVPDFYGWKAVLEDFLVHLPYNTEYTGESVTQVQARKRERWTGERIAAMPWVNICLVAANVIVFLICAFSGELLYNKGAFGVIEVMQDGSYYRIITAIFLHADAQHLFSNMIVLYYVGEIVERKLGHLTYIMVYFLSGVAGNVFSAGYELLLGEYYSSVGASGAVFGMEGALLFLVIMNHGKLEQMTTGRLVFAIMFSLYSGFTSTNINNAAHIGGVLMGFAATAIVIIMRSQIRTRKDRDFNEN